MRVGGKGRWMQIYCGGGGEGVWKLTGFGAVVP